MDFFLALIWLIERGGSSSFHKNAGIAFKTHPQHVSEASVSKINLSPDLGR